MRWNHLSIPNIQDKTYFHKTVYNNAVYKTSTVLFRSLSYNWSFYILYIAHGRSFLSSSDLFSISLEWEIIRRGHFRAVTRKRDVYYPQDMETRGPLYIKMPPIRIRILWQRLSFYFKMESHHLAKWHIQIQTPLRLILVRWMIMWTRFRESRKSYVFIILTDWLWPA